MNLNTSTVAEFFPTQLRLPMPNYKFLFGQQVSTEGGRDNLPSSAGWSYV